MKISALTVYDNRALALRESLQKPINMMVNNTQIIDTINQVKVETIKLQNNFFNFEMKAEDKTTSVLDKIKDKLLGALKLKDRLKETIGDAAKIEQEEISLKHSISVKNKGKSAQEVNKMTEEYTKSLNKEASSTAFSKNEIISAGRSAVSITGGDTKEALQLVKLAENMAALNPGKTVKDAMNALKNLKFGDKKALNDFGIVFKEKEDISNFKETVASKVSPTFHGGTDKMKESSKGQFDMIKGNLQTMGTNLIQPLLPLANKILIPLSGILERNVEKATKFGQSISKGITQAYKAISQYIPGIKKFLKSVWEESAPTIMSLCNLFKDSFIPFIGRLYGIVMEAMPGISDVFKSAFSIIGFLVQEACKIIGVFINIIVGIYDFIEPVLSWIIGIFNKVASVVEKAMGMMLRWNKDTPESKAMRDSLRNGNVLIEDEEAYKEPPEIKTFDETKVLENGIPFILPRGENVLTAGETKQKDKSWGNINVSKLSDQIIVREEADIDKITDAMVKKIKMASINS